MAINQNHHHLGMRKPSLTHEVRNDKVKYGNPTHVDSEVLNIMNSHIQKLKPMMNMNFKDRPEQRNFNLISTHGKSKPGPFERRARSTMKQFKTIQINSDLERGRNSVIDSIGMMTPVPLPPLEKVNQGDYSGTNMSFGAHQRRFSQATFDTSNDVEMSTPNREVRSSAMGIYGNKKANKGKNYEPTKISERGSGISIAGPLGSDTR